jgi:hypothetical protein
MSAVACGSSSKSTPAPAAPAAEPAAASAEAEQKPELGPKPIAQEEAAPESTEPECKKDKDCIIFSDCCTCKAVPLAGKPPVPCDAVCGESKCEVQGKTQDNVSCVSGRCKVIILNR